MSRTPRTAALAAAAALAVLPAAVPAAAAPADDAPVTTAPRPVALDNDPWVPHGKLDIALGNPNETGTPGTVQLLLPATLTVRDDKRCTAVDPGTLPAVPATVAAAWSCALGTVPAKGGKEATVRLRSATAEPVFGVEAKGWVRGAGAAGVGANSEFAVAWPARLPVRLAAKPGANNGGTVAVTAAVTNAGTIPLRGYALLARVPAGVTVASKYCKATAHAGKDGCEVLRLDDVAPGRADEVTIKFRVGSRGGAVELWLAPPSRYPNKDTSTRVTLPPKG
ncbi:hypothetical protein GCM10010123_28880 [Pilimelia anulata]|uniref:Uncharacterized protein n=1 Tax=Pilimelia anulata TaxID=53371 RepID=A0A8J3BC51_9ACTN|nr:hypothetical protein [Pilimelia anulata]GGJ97110.1 hypothetical protein GCM10010123_28880 [Pilimelia anulata]